MVNIKETLKSLGLSSNNQGVSTGSENFGSGAVIESYSPVDGKLIGTVTTETKEDYEVVNQIQDYLFFVLVNI